MQPVRASDPATWVAAAEGEAESALADELAELLRAKPGAVLGLATGSTPLGLYRELARRVRAGELSFARATTFNLDEFVGLPAGHPRSFEAWMRAQLLDEIDLPRASAHFPDARARDLPAAAREFERRIADAGGIDLQILGIGRNGHIGFNEPGSPRDSRTREVELHPWTRADAAPAFGGLEHVPARALTMGVATILGARRIRALAFGARKAAIVRATLRGAVGPDVPSTWLRGHADARLYLDPDAAAELAPARERGLG
jgi:glucosamine-6-phosphate deaminase